MERDERIGRSGGSLLFLGTGEKKTAFKKHYLERNKKTSLWFKSSTVLAIQKAVTPSAFGKIFILLGFILLRLNYFLD